jgi:hypothetical protein
MPRAISALLPLVACATVACNDPAAPDRRVAAIVILDGNGTRGGIGELARQPVVIEARNAAGRPLPGVELTATASHDGTALGVNTVGDTLEGAGVTDAQGRARFAWRFGKALEEQALTVSAPGAATVAVRGFAGVPLTAVVTVTLGDSVIPVGGTTLASATITTAAGEVIDYPWGLYWNISNNSPVATVSSGGTPPPSGSPLDARGPVTITGVSPGRVQLSASVNIAISTGSVTSRTGFTHITVVP